MDSERRTLSEALTKGLNVLAEILPAHQARYALIGGIAVGVRSRLRYTEDIDLILSIPQLRLPGLLESLSERGFDLDVLNVIAQWTQDHMVALYFAGVKVDLLKPVLPAYQHVIDTATSESWDGRDLCIASTEGILLTKLIASRGQDLIDIATLLASHQGQLDLGWIEREWLSIFDASDARWQKFRQQVAEYYERETN